ncbi:hypothetical protein [Halovivax cerinus]|uniref:Small CPxCG-related zinc finger protein n=1 Tax=Halovivax cerinus TaxID=1487865 RepID=A0ABD5NTB4_9EURY|nr:hypothetical protein [Halovivax cerinus]
MTSARQSTANADESPDPRECYRCDRPTVPEFLFRVRVEPPDLPPTKYAPSERYCCEHCAAAMNLSEFSQEWKNGASR